MESGIPKLFRMSANRAMKPCNDELLFSSTPV
jgi:hypothetical protein